MIRSGPVNGSGLVSRSGLVGRSGLVFLSISIVLDISDVSRISINTVGYSLGTTVGKENGVFSSGSITVPGFIGTKVDTGIIVLDIVSVVISGRGVIVGGFFIGRGVVSRGSVGGGTVSGSQSQKGGECNKGLKKL